MSGDLHCHSICSDGSCTTAQIVEYARRQGITHIALTDHDTMMGVERIRQEAARKGLVTISGVECTARDRLRNRSVHMLCYLPEKPLELQRFLDTTLARRREAKLAMVDKLAQRYPLTREDVLLASKDSASIHEVHLMAPLAAMGYTPAVCGPLLRELLGKDGSCYVPIIYPDVYEVLEAIHSVGGLAVLAHPGQFDSLELAQELAKRGVLDGVECDHPRNNAGVRQAARALCRRYGLLMTGGTDFHGMYAASPHPIGSCITSEEQLKRLLSKDVPFGKAGR